MVKYAGEAADATTDGTDIDGEIFESTGYIRP